MGYSPGRLEESDMTEQLNTAEVIPTLFLYPTHFPLSLSSISHLLSSDQ